MKSLNIKPIKLNKYGKKLNLNDITVLALVNAPNQTKGDRYLIDLFKNSFCEVNKYYINPLECFQGLIQILNGIDLSPYQNGYDLSDLDNLIPAPFDWQCTLSTVLYIKDCANRAVEIDAFDIQS